MTTRAALSLVALVALCAGYAGRLAAQDADQANRDKGLSLMAEARKAIADGIVTGGMIPKLEEAMAVIDQGVGAIHILGKLAAGDLVRAVREPGSVGTTLHA